MSRYRELADAATPRPWEVVYRPIAIGSQTGIGGNISANDGRGILDIVECNAADNIVNPEAPRAELHYGTIDAALIVALANAGDDINRLWRMARVATGQLNSSGAANTNTLGKLTRVVEDLSPLFGDNEEG